MAPTWAGSGLFVNELPAQETNLLTVQVSGETPNTKKFTIVKVGPFLLPE